MISQISVDCHVEEKHLSGTKQSYCKVRLCGSSADQQCHTDMQCHTTSVTHLPEGGEKLQQHWAELTARMGSVQPRNTSHIRWMAEECRDV